MVEPERRRRRQPVSCTICRKRKLRCNRESPCSNCTRSRNAICVYDHVPLRPAVLRTENQPASPESTGYRDILPRTPNEEENYLQLPRSIVTATTPPSAADVDSIRNQIRVLEAQLHQAGQLDKNSPGAQSVPRIDEATSSLGGTFYVNQNTQSDGSKNPVARGVMHKTRLFGQSHFFNIAVLFRDLIQVTEPRLRHESHKAILGMSKCKSLAKAIKAQRTMLWPYPSEHTWPAKSIADELVECYFKTMETLYRVLHIPSFKRDYNAYWESQHVPDPVFLIQLKLVLAIGAVTYDDSFSLRSSATQWVYEAQALLPESGLKSRLNLQYLQSNILLILARELVDVSGEMTWVSVGSLYRTAVYMGLHRDPSVLPQKSPLILELRRRLWNTILELALQSSTASGGPPLISCYDFDTQPPKNLNDDQLDVVTEPSPKEILTEMSFAIALRETFPHRLAIVKMLNDLQARNSYEETMRLDGEMRAACKNVRKTLQGLKTNATSGSPPSEFAMRAVDTILHGYISALHMPFFGLALQESKYAFSRKVVLESSLRAWYTANPAPSPLVTPVTAGSEEGDHFYRMTMIAPGFFRIVAFQACLAVALEIRAQLKEDEDAILGPVPLHRDLLSVVEAGKAWSLMSIEAGETSIKGYLLLSVVAAQIEATIGNVKKDDIPEILVKAVEQAEEVCLPILERKVAERQEEGNSTTGPELEVDLNVPSEMTIDWNLMMSTSLFDFGDADQMIW